MMRRFYPLVLATIVSLTLFSCQKKQRQKEERFAHISILAPVRSLEPRFSHEKSMKNIVNMLYEGLMRLDSNGNVVPALAESVAVSEDRMTYTFTLRNSSWSNGDPVTAYDFEYAWKKSVDPKYAQTGASTFYAIKNVAACLKNEASIDEVGVKSIDDKTLEVELEHPAPYFLYLCTCPTYSPVHKKIDCDHPGWGSTLNPYFISNGPFKLKKWKKGVEISLERNPLYFDAVNVRLSGISVQIIEDPNTQIFLFEKGELDWIGHPFNPLPIDVIGDFQEDGALDCVEAYGVSWYFLNTEQPPFNNKNFRKAVAYAINRKEIIDHVLKLGETPAMGILNGELAVQEKPHFEDGNIMLARKYLKEALKEMETEELPSIVLSQRANPLTSRVSQVIQDQLRVALGLKVEIDQVDWPVHLDRVSKGNYEMGEMGWYSLLKDPIYMLDTFRGRHLASNMSRWEHPHYQELLKKSDAEIDPKKRKEYLRQAETLLMEEMPIIPLCFNSQYYLKNKNLKGVYVSPLKEIDFRYASFSEE
ncbi:peptide ABC transporter substrate-binding protein [Candidatus Neptunochlamydia vexilliferae]|nr:peptide ABC transporter substrate-binding protein [Candidatus Neptunochlamydia vexilliferae]